MANAIPSLIQALRAEGLPCAEGEPLARHCTFRIGGPAAVFCTPHTAPALLRALELRTGRFTSPHLPAWQRVQRAVCR